MGKRKTSVAQDDDPTIRVNVYPNAVEAIHSSGFGVVVDGEPATAEPVARQQLDDILAANGVERWAPTDDEPDAEDI